MGDNRADQRHERPLTGVDILHEPSLNKGTAFTEVERERLGLRGLLPARVLSQADQIQRILENFHDKTSDIEKYIFLISLQDRNERLFYRVVMDHVEEMMPIIYTPTVGLACQRYGHIWRRPRGVFVTANDRGRIGEVLANWPYGPVRAIVVTDGERILGLGDLGANGMGIPVGKLSLYTVCAGVDPGACLPITLDVGTRNTALRADPLYPGLAQERLAGDDYDDFVHEFITAATARFPGVLIQFEDFGKANALRLLRRYRESTCCFNDDIQGTAGVVLAGFRAIGRMLPERELRAQKILLVGAGEAGIGIAHLVTEALVREGLSADEARRRCWFVDSKGLVVKERTDLDAYKREFAHDHAPAGDVLAAVRALRPTALIGVSGQPQLFTREIVAAMTDANERPIVFALSNPTSKAECTAEQAYAWSDGRALFASGSPFAPVEVAGRRLVPGQANNAYIFPGVGLGILASGARRVTDEMFAAAAEALAAEVSDADWREGRVFPPLGRVRALSLDIATAVARVAHAGGLATAAPAADLRAFIEAQVYDPSYEHFA